MSEYMDDTTMAVRMIEYDFATAVEFARKQGRRYRMEFPRSCVLYPSGSNTPDFWKWMVFGWKMSFVQSAHD